MLTLGTMPPTQGQPSRFSTTLPSCDEVVCNLKAELHVIMIESNVLIDYRYSKTTPFVKNDDRATGLTESQALPLPSNLDAMPRETRHFTTA